MDACFVRPLVRTTAANVFRRLVACSGPVAFRLAKSHGPRGIPTRGRGAAVRQYARNKSNVRCGSGIYRSRPPLPARYAHCSVKNVTSRVNVVTASA